MNGFIINDNSGNTDLKAVGYFSVSFKIKTVKI